MKQKASISIEAAIVVPLVFFSLLLVYSLMNYLQIEYRITQVAQEAAVELSYESHIYHELELTEIIAHFSKQRQSLKAEDITGWKEMTFSPQPSDENKKAEESLKEWVDVTKGLLEKIKKVPAEWKQITKTEGTVLTTRLFFNSFLREKMIRKLEGKAGFQAKNLDILWASYFYDMKSSDVFIRYLYEFPVAFPFLKPAEIKIPIHFDSFVGNIKRYDGEDYKPKEEKEPEKEMVYVTDSGGRYHTNRQCRAIYRVVSKVEKSSIEKGEECKTCKKLKHTFSSFVYKTEKSKTYHAVETCSQITRKVSEITREQAEERGLSHCKICEN